MGRRRLDTRGRERDDPLVAPARVARTTATSRPNTLTDHLLSMQRGYGNAAVTAALQRRDRPQSTDAPGHHDSQKKQAPAEDYAPTAPNPKLSGWTDDELAARASSELDSTVKNSLYFAAELYEEYWFRHKVQAAAVGIYRAYKKLGDDKREKFWLDVMHGTIKPGANKPEDQTGKDF